jgi:hypothetical protein
VPAEILIGAMEKAASRLGRVTIEPERIPADGAMAVRLCIRLEPAQPHLPAGKARRYLAEAVEAVALNDVYADFARRALAVLIEAEREAHGSGRLPVLTPGADRHEPHPHHGEGVVLHEAQDILIDVVGAAVGLQHLGVDMARVVCLSPVRVGGGFITFSHGRFSVPAPAVRVLLQRYDLPHAAGPVEKELLTPTGASLLAALAPAFHDRDDWNVTLQKIGVGRGLRRMEPPGDLRIGLW